MTADISLRVDFGSELKKIVVGLNQRNFISLVGYRKVGKTQLIQSAVEQYVQDEFAPETTIVYFDLRENSYYLKAKLYNSLADSITTNLYTSKYPPFSDQITRNITSGVQLHSYVNEVLEQLETHLLLIVDHLEAIPAFLATDLLTCFQTMYSHRNNVERRSFRRFVVVVVGTAPIHELTSDETSAFRSNKVHLVDPSPNKIKASLKVLRNEKNEALLDDSTIDVIVARCGQNICTINAIITKSIEKSAERKTPIDHTLVSHVIDSYEYNEWLNEEQFLWAIDHLCSDPASLGFVARCLDSHNGSLSDRHAGSIFESNVELSGAFRRLEGGGYEWRNRLFEDTITRYFEPLTMVDKWLIFGDWNNAFKHLISLNSQLRGGTDLQRLLNYGGQLVSQANSRDAAIRAIIATVTKIMTKGNITLHLVTKLENGTYTILPYGLGTRGKLEVLSNKPLSGTDLVSQPSLLSLQNGIQVFTVSESGLKITMPMLCKTGQRFGTLLIEDAVEVDSFWQHNNIMSEVEKFLRKYTNEVCYFDFVETKFDFYQLSLEKLQKNQILRLRLLLISALVSVLLIFYELIVYLELDDLNELLTNTIVPLINALFLLSVSISSGYFALKVFSNQLVGVFVSIIALSVTIITVAFADGLPNLFKSYIFLMLLITLQIIMISVYIYRLKSRQLSDLDYPFPGHLEQQVSRVDEE